GLSTDYKVTGLNDNVHFYISPKQGLETRSIRLSSVFKILAVLLLLIYVHFLAETLAKKYGFWKGLAFLVAALILLRLISYFLPFPVNLRQFELFDPKVYGSNLIHK